jgi:hypothetical protein
MLQEGENQSEFERPSQSINGESGDQGSMDGGASWIIVAAIVLCRWPLVWRCLRFFHPKKAKEK